eukprot:g2562.t1
MTIAKNAASTRELPKPNSAHRKHSKSRTLEIRQAHSKNSRTLGRMTAKPGISSPGMGTQEERGSATSSMFSLLDKSMFEEVDDDMADSEENSGVGAPRQDAANRSAFRRLFGIDQILLPAATLAILAGLECVAFTLMFERFNLKPEGQSEGKFGLFNIDSMPFLVAASLSSFMVVFRAQICYNRWWEGRTHIGGINKCFKTLLLLTASAKNGNGAERKAGSNSARLLFAGFATIIQQLWSDTDLEPLRDLLSEEEYLELQKPTVNRPLLIINWLTEQLRDRNSVFCNDDARRIAIWEECSQLNEYLNSALKVAYTPIPKQYHVATRFILYSFCFTNPACLAFYH